MAVGFEEWYEREKNGEGFTADEKKIISGFSSKLYKAHMKLMGTNKIGAGLKSALNNASSGISIVGGDTDMLSLGLDFEDYWPDAVQQAEDFAKFLTEGNNLKEFIDLGKSSALSDDEKWTANELFAVMKLLNGKPQLNMKLPELEAKHEELLHPKAEPVNDNTININNINNNNNINNIENLNANINNIENLNAANNAGPQAEPKPAKKSYQIKDASPHSMAENVTFIDGIISEFDEVVTENAHADVKVIGAELKKLRALSVTYSGLDRDLTLDEFKAFDEQVTVVKQKITEVAPRLREDLADHPNKDKLMTFLINTKDALIKNSDVIDSEIIPDMKFKNTSKVFGDLLDLVYKNKPSARENAIAFYGEENLESYKRQGAKHGFSLGRTGGLSTSMMILAAKGFTLDEIMDPTKRVQEKRQTFDEVAMHMRKGEKEDQEWLAKNLYDGINAALKLQDETIAKIDFKTETFANSERYAKLVNFCGMIHDAWQETYHCIDELDAYAKTKDPESSAEKFRDSVTTRQGLFAFITQNVEDFVGNATHIFRDNGEVSDHALSQRMSNLYFIDKYTQQIIRNKKTDRPHSEWSQPADITYNTQLGQFTAQKFLNVRAKFDYMEFDEQVDAAKYMLSPEVIRKLNVTDKGDYDIEIKGIPSNIQLEAEVDMKKKDNRSERIAAIREQITFANNAVFHSSGEFDDASKAIRKLQESYEKYERLGEDAKIAAKRQALAEIQEKSREAEYRINKYFNRKQKQLDKGTTFQKKTQNRIDIMKTALKEIKAGKNETNRKTIALESNELKKFAAEQSVFAAKKLEKLAGKPGPDRKLAPEELKEAKKYMAVMLSADAVRSMKNPEQKLAGDTKQDQFLGMVKETYGKGGFSMAANEFTSKKLSKFLRDRSEFVTNMNSQQRIMDGFRKTAPAKKQGGLIKK